LSGPARKFWDEAVPGLVEAGVVGEIDSPAIVACCEAWALFRLAVAAAAKDPCDKDARAAVVAYLAQWVTLASKLGLTPADRQRLVAAADPAGDDAVSEFARKRGL
jgi:phage terminase small subunit